MSSVLPIFSLLFTMMLPFAPQEIGGSAIAEQVFRNNCMICHGQDLEGGFGPELLHVGSRKSKAQIAQQIQHGGMLMPAFGNQLDAGTIETLAQWLSEKK
ncbi:cytochrome c [Brevibacillus choshinensis]|uniref:c-type cytochrome n=1 Tax=Brevibacillus choshinensis TaxID=54911 RepID=UPI002E22BE0F|nr:cytochrome c [Brevibacillus choshinensis]